MKAKNINKKKIDCRGKIIECVFRKSSVARRLRLTVHCDGRVVATMPSGFPYRLAEEFVLEKTDWIARKVEQFRKKNLDFLVRSSREEFLMLKGKALELVLDRLAYYNQFYGAKINRVNIRQQRTRWGSCSYNGNLSFNYKLIFLDKIYQDYVIVHELCHLKEMNHSHRFWRLVGQTIPDYRRLAKEIRKM